MENDNYADDLLGIDTDEGTPPESATQVPNTGEGAPPDPAEPAGLDAPSESAEPALPADQEHAFAKRMERERVKLEQKLRTEIEQETRTKLAQQLQGTAPPALTPEQARQHLYAQMQQDPVGTIYQMVQEVTRQNTAPLMAQHQQMERNQRVADLALRYGTELSDLAPHMKIILDAHPEWWDTQDGLEIAYRWAKVEAGTDAVREAVARNQAQQKQITDAKAQARAAGGQATSTAPKTPEEEAAAYADELVRIR